MNCHKCGSEMDALESSIDGAIAFDCPGCGHWFIGQHEKEQPSRIVVYAVALAFMAACWYFLYIMLAPLF